MMNLQTTTGTNRWPSFLPPPTLKREDEQRWSSLAEVVELLQFDGQIFESDNPRMFKRRRVKAGQTALRAGQPFDGLYVVRLGALKTSMSHMNGAEHVLTFPMKGDLVGYDGAFKNQYLSEVVALTDCDLIRIPSADFFRRVGAATISSAWPTGRSAAKSRKNRTAMPCRTRPNRKRA